MVQLKTLSDFKRFLAQPGATIQIIRHDWAADRAPNAGAFKNRPGFFDPRKVKTLQTNAVCFTTPGDSRGSWLYFKSAKTYRFDGDQVTCALKDDFSEVMVYRCSIDSAESNISVDGEVSPR